MAGRPAGTVVRAAGTLPAVGTPGATGMTVGGRTPAVVAGKRQAVAGKKRPV